MEQRRKRNRSKVSPLVSKTSKKMHSEESDMTTMQGHGACNDPSAHANVIRPTIVDSLRQHLEKVNDDSDLSDTEARIVKSVMLLFDDRLKTHTDQITQKLNQEIDSHNKTHESLRKMDIKYDLLESKYNDMAKKYDSLLDRVVKSELKAMRNNLIISGIAESFGNKEADLRQWIKDVITSLNGNPDVNISAIHRLRPKGNGKPRDVIVRFEDFKVKREFFAHRFKIKEKEKYKDIFISEQFPPEIQEERKVLRAIAAEARLQKPELARKISVYENTLFIDGRKFTTSNLHMLPPSLQHIVQGFKQNHEALVFFTKRSPFSNHFPTKFTHEDMTYANGEQLFMMQKARCYGDEDAMKKILENDNPVVIKGIGNSIGGFEPERWHQSAMNLLVPGILSKFEQNEECKAALLASGERALGEATTEDPWGVGMRLSDPNVLNINLWTEKRNIMGKVLERIRSILREREFPAAMPNNL